MYEQHHPVVGSLLNLIKALRSDQNLTHEDLADKANVDRTTIGRLERGERAPSVAVASQIANALGYPLSELLLKAELISEGKLSEVEAFAEERARKINLECLRNQAELEAFTGLDAMALSSAIQTCYHTLDMIDEQLVSHDSAPIGKLVELANLSSMVGNLVGGALADCSDGLYKRNKPHHYPDLLPLKASAKNLELKMALETNRPKGHLPKPGHYITFRYVLGDRLGAYARGKEMRGDTVWIWEVKVGTVRDVDFDISNTEGDSGKTAIIKSSVFNAMKLVYFDKRYCPYALRNDTYPGFN
ncbi:MAG: helix-turn-helix transcriptional regulator [Betaproteobacteria bacterium]